MRCRSLLYKEIIVGDYPIIGSTAIMPYKEESFVEIGVVAAQSALFKSPTLG